MKPLKAGVIGHPITHSKSPLIHQYWLNEHELSGNYELIDIAPNNLETDIRALIDQGYDGFNVTIPHKENIFKLCDELSPAAKEIGAVNTVQIKNKKLIGHNTDHFGFIENIKMSTANYNFFNKNIFIIGAGGATRAIIYGLLKNNVGKIYITNRTKERAKKLQVMDPEKIKIIDWENKNETLSKIDLLINTTSLGMNNHPELEINIDTLSSNALVTDIVYTPLMTGLLKKAKNNKNQIVTGVGMLLHQARPAFELWTGISPNVTPELEQIVLGKALS